MTAPRPRGPHPEQGGDDVAAILAGADASLLDLVDHLLNQGVVLRAEVILGLAGVDLVYLQVTALLCSADRLLAPRPE